MNSKILLMVVIAFFAITACMPSLQKNKLTEENTILKNCYDEEHYKDHAERIPKRITLAQKRSEERQSFMSSELLKERLVKNNRFHFFEYNFKQEQPLSDLDYKSTQSKSLMTLRMYHEFKLEYIHYDFDNERDNTAKHQVLPIERQEMISLINIVTDNPKKSQEILAELEKIYQDKLHRNEFLEKYIPFISKDLAVQRLVKYKLLGYFLERFHRYGYDVVDAPLHNSTEQLEGYDNTHINLRTEGLKGIHYSFL